MNDLFTQASRILVPYLERHCSQFQRRDRVFGLESYSSQPVVSAECEIHYLTQRKE